jgi:hypothetical protein
MKSKKLDLFKSVINFRNEIEETHILIQALQAQIFATEQFLKSFKLTDSTDYSKFKKLLEIDKKQTDRLYELGFIAFFANFECFMFEFLKNLFKKYPTSFKSDKVIKFMDIKDFKDVTEIRDYFIDSIAIEKSYDIDTWNSFIQQKFRIKVFKSKRQLGQFKMLNALRNLILHSGSKTNSKFRNEMRNFIKTPVPLGDKFTLDREKYFYILYRHMKLLVTTIESN